MNSKYGFEDECADLLGYDFAEAYFNLATRVFDVLPFACLVDGRILVVHGGLGTARWRLEDLIGVRRPMTSKLLALEENEWLNAILWSDPIEDDHNGENVFGVHPSPRGKVATQFGWDVTKVFCARNGLSLVVRSHQSKRGSPGFDLMHDNLLIRVFSARDYEGHGNDAAILHVRKFDEGAGPWLEAPECGKVTKEDTMFVRSVLWVRPQVVRSAAKTRKQERHDAMYRRKSMEAASTVSADKLGPFKVPKSPRQDQHAAVCPSSYYAEQTDQASTSSSGSETSTSSVSSRRNLRARRAAENAEKKVGRSL